MARMVTHESSLPRRLAWLLLWLPGLFVAGVLYFHAGALAAAAFACALAGCAMRGHRRGAALAALLVALGLAGWWRLAPAQQRDWLEDVSRVPRVEREGDLLVFSQVRDFRYRGPDDSDPVPRWETRRYDPARITGLDIFLSDWGAPGVVHTILSWRFAEGPPLAISIETRKEKGETYSALAGFFRAYELIYVVGDERDLIGVRAAHRGERVSLYALGGRPGAARRLLEAYVEDINALAHTPRWYNALSTNCTTGILRLARHVLGESRRLDWRIYANRSLPALMREEGVINTTLPLAELQSRADITARAIAADGAADFSQRIRAGLPLPPPTPGEAVAPP
ncbi:MAG: DUF4105 domain-containing protein [Candidatus Dactylopiibacterium sp.]|nr:DUF4105 domain-containing protein [Candidatus Dactylopiibacterium sp.]